jgi:hypothetical protein
VSRPAMSADLEKALREIRPRCQTTRIRELRTIFTARRVEEPCQDPATHYLTLTCAGDHGPHSPKLMCARHHAALQAQRSMAGSYRCECGQRITMQAAML